MVGSGTLIYSARAQTGEGYESYALTSYHAIRNIMSDAGYRKERGIAETQPTLDMLQADAGAYLGFTQLTARKH